MSRAGVVCRVGLPCPGTLPGIVGVLVFVFVSSSSAEDPQILVADRLPLSLTLAPLHVFLWRASGLSIASKWDGHVSIGTVSQGYAHVAPDLATARLEKWCCRYAVK